MIWIDLVSGGNKRGSGPITSILSWKFTRRLDRAGEFSFTMPASDPKANNLAYKLQVWAYSDSNVGPQLIGRGLIDKITVRAQPGQAGSILEVSGGDLLRELSFRTVGDLDLIDLNANTPDVVSETTYSGTTYLYNGSWVATSFYCESYARWLYVEAEAPFHSVNLTISGANNNTGTMLAQYYDGDGWRNLEIVDGTASAGAPFAQTGTVAFAPPSNWATLGGRYVLRIHASATTDTITLSSPYVTINQYEPTPDGLSDIIAKASGLGWSLDTTNGFGSTKNDVYLLMAGESVLAALIRLAEQTGEHFRLATGFTRKVLWLQDSQLSSGYRAMAPQYMTGEDNTVVLPLLSLEKVQDTYELVTRVYPHGGGSGSARVTLANTIKTAPGGYTMNMGLNYLEMDAAVLEYGQIDRYMSWPDIVAVSTEISQVQHAADSLFDRVYEYLKRACQPAEAYRLRTAGNHGVHPGQTIRVVYHEFVDGYHAVDIDAELWVLEITDEYGADGQRVSDWIVSTVDRWQTSDQSVVLATASRDETDRAMQKPQSRLTFTDSGWGMVHNIVVQDGQVTSVHRELPVADGYYKTGDELTPTGQQGAITIRNGVIVAIQEAS